MKRTILKKGNSSLSKTTKLKLGTQLSKSSKLTRSGKLKAKLLTAEQKEQRSEDIRKMWGLFEEHWNSKAHKCESCDAPIWGENKSLYHDHLLDKGIKKYEHLKYEISNLFLCCWQCHANKGAGNPSKPHREAIENAKKKFGII